ncbi:MAG: hypothetical protein ABWJ63_08905, partial [Thermus sp.]|uniref:hypothetical protein n=1 Tax=Thermus sp. TaxID=275 RepID=UPI00351B7171
MVSFDRRYSGQITLSLERSDGGPPPAGVSLAPTNLSANRQTRLEANLSLGVATDTPPAEYALRLKVWSKDFTAYHPIGLTVISRSNPAPNLPLYSAGAGGVYKDGVALPLYGLNWFGLETCDRAPHGLWSGRSVTEILAQVRGYGFNALRLPVSPAV